jgi:hypothetical protein
MQASTALDAYIDESIGVAIAHGYTPSTFQRMRRDHGTLEAMSRLVKNDDIQSGFRRLKQLGLLQWTIEAAILRFPDEFTRDARECAQWRLEQAQAEG